ncbi:MAG: hemerythrin domain-containing protein [Holophaga sp.]
MPNPASSLPPVAIHEAELADWQRIHQDALSAMADLSRALDRQDWQGVEQACRWVRETFQAHNRWEEQGPLPRLARAGGRSLQGVLRTDHQEMDLLAGAILQADGRGRALQPHLQGARARRLLDLVRQHVDTEAHRALPLLQGQRPLTEAAPEGAGYHTPVRFRGRR